MSRRAGPPPRPTGRKRRTGRSRRRSRPPKLAVASAVLMVGVLLASAWWGWREAREPREPSEDPFARQLELPPEPNPIARVEVLNGAGEPGAARQAAEVLRAAGFDVVYFGNASEFGNRRTRVIDRVGVGAKADSVAGWLQVERLETEPDPTLHLDATVILGDDWRRCFRLDGSAARPGLTPDR